MAGGIIDSLLIAIGSMSRKYTYTEMLGILDLVDGTAIFSDVVAGEFYENPVIWAVANGITNVHVYSMNKPDVAEKIQANLSSIIKK